MEAPLAGLSREAPVLDALAVALEGLAGQRKRRRVRIRARAVRSGWMRGLGRRGGGQVFVRSGARARTGRVDDERAGGGGGGGGGRGAWPLVRLLP